MSSASWDDWAAGRECPFDTPRADVTEHWDLVRKLAISSWYLPVNQMYRGHGILVFDPRHVTRLDELTTAEWQAYAADLQRVAAAIVAVCKPDHMNVESLGNVVPHLHWHLIPRYKNDGRWRGPIWAQSADVQPQRRLDEDDRAGLLAALRKAL